MSSVEVVTGGVQLRVPPDGYVYVEVPEGPDWRLCMEPKRCRWGAGGGGRGCGAPAVAELNRGLNRSRWIDGRWVARSFDSWWAYCGEHLYGRRIVDGEILTVRLVPEVEA